MYQFCLVYAVTYYIVTVHLSYVHLSYVHRSQPKCIMVKLIWDFISHSIRVTEDGKPKDVLKGLIINIKRVGISEAKSTINHALTCLRGVLAGDEWDEIMDQEEMRKRILNFKSLCHVEMYTSQDIPIEPFMTAVLLTWETTETALTSVSLSKECKRNIIRQVSEDVCSTIWNELETFRESLLCSGKEKDVDLRTYNLHC